MGLSQELRGDLESTPGQGTCFAEVALALPEKRQIVQRSQRALRMLLPQPLFTDLYGSPEQCLRLLIVAGVGGSPGRPGANVGPVRAPSLSWRVAHLPVPTGQWHGGAFLWRWKAAVA